MTVALFLIVPSSLARDRQPDDGVVRDIKWGGIISVTARDHTVETHPEAPELEWHEESTHDVDQTVSVVEGEATATVNLRISYERRSLGCLDEKYTIAASGSGPVAFEVNLFTDDRSYTLGVGRPSLQGTRSGVRPAQRQPENWNSRCLKMEDYSEPFREGTDRDELVWRLLHDQTLGRDPTQLIGTEHGVAGHGIAVPSMTWHLTSKPVATEAVLTTEEGYEHWLPEAGETEDASGNTLAVTVRLQEKGKPGKKSLQKARFRFELLEVSREKGLCLNSPAKDKAKDDFDLKIDPNENPDLQGIPADGQSADTRKGLDEADVVITSHDWGAWGKLKVTATLDDGTPIVAHLEKDRTKTVLVVPIDDNGNHVADAWEKDNRIFEDNLPADWDEAEEPRDQKGSGDGISLYEKYRGFFANFSYERLDPHSKFLFVYDPTDVVSSPEFWAGSVPDFEAASGVQLRFVDQDEWTGAGSSQGEKRIVNFNHGWGHAVDQHALHVDVGNTWDPPEAWLELMRKNHVDAGTIPRLWGITYPDGADWHTFGPPANTFLIVYDFAKIVDDMDDAARDALCASSKYDKQRDTTGLYQFPCYPVRQQIKADLKEYTDSHSKEMISTIKRLVALTVTHELGHGVGIQHHDAVSDGDKECVVRYFAEKECPPNPKDPYGLRCHKPWPSKISRDPGHTAGGTGCWQAVIVKDRD